MAYELFRPPMPLIIPELLLIFHDFYELLQFMCLSSTQIYHLILKYFCANNLQSIVCKCNFVPIFLNAEGEGRADTAGTNNNSFNRLWQPEKGVSRKGWKSREIGSERIISRYTSRGVLRHAWSKWCRENLVY